MHERAFVAGCCALPQDKGKVAAEKICSQEQGDEALADPGFPDIGRRSSVSEHRILDPEGVGADPTGGICLPHPQSCQRLQELAAHQLGGPATYVPPLAAPRDRAGPGASVPICPHPSPVGDNRGRLGYNSRPWPTSAAL